MPFGAFSGRGCFFRFSSQNTELGEGGAWQFAFRRWSRSTVSAPTLVIVLTADEIAAFQQAFKGPLASYGRLDELVPPALAPIAPRSPGYRPAASENPYGAWYWKTNIRAVRKGC